DEVTTHSRAGAAAARDTLQINDPQTEQDRGQ
ncbi:MAG TPA: electron transport complex subunit G, partial [Pseudomonas sp.]|nr:electron transport complex subunit G [Pseudomonas sp.]